MRFFVKNCNTESLVLIDEFGTGTEPMLGGAIAESILKRINLLGTFGVITTHYTNLKHFASSAEGIVNAAMLYDSHRMEPLFQLEIGKPGSSFAFEIARKIGLPEEILQEATEKVGAEHIDFDKHLRDIVRDKRYWETKRQKVHQSEKKLDELIQTYETNLSETKKLRKEILDQAKKEAQEILSASNRIIESTIREIKEAAAEKERTREIRQKVEEFKEEIVKKNEEAEELINRKMEKLLRREDRKKNRVPKTETAKQTPGPRKVTEEIKVGSWVRLKEQNTSGEVLEIKSDNITVAFGQLRSTVKRSKLELVSRNESRRTASTNNTLARINIEIGEKKLNFKPNIDVRGLRAEEALQKIQEFLDEAMMVEAKEIRILHGKGNGILEN
jgi:DNA mismatch repair protein MutS2